MAARLPVVAVLALQGDYEAHRAALAARGLDTREARTAADLEGAGGLVFPGGESTTMLKLMEGTGVTERLTQLIGSGVPTLATCAGMILLAREVTNPAQASLGLVDIAVERNGYGRQIDSTVVPLAVEAPEELGAAALEGVFIRAPRVVRVGAAVRVLARRGVDPVLVRQGHVLAATFHPELSRGSAVVGLFESMVRERR